MTAHDHAKYVPGCYRCDLAEAEMPLRVGDKVICVGCPTHGGQPGEVLTVTERTVRVRVDGGAICWPLRAEFVSGPAVEERPA